MSQTFILVPRLPPPSSFDHYTCTQKRVWPKSGTETRNGNQEMRKCVQHSASRHKLNIVLSRLVRSADNEARILYVVEIYFAV